MNIYKVMSKNSRTGTLYADSYWLKQENAEAHAEHLKLSDSLEDVEDAEDWNHYVAKVHTSDEI